MISNNKVKPEGGLLQSEYWANLWKKENKQVINIKGENLRVFGVIQNVKFIGKYLYVPRLLNEHLVFFDELIEIAKNNNCKWIRVDIDNKEQIKKMSNFSILKAPHDMQPKEHFIVKLPSSSEEILEKMKSKTRYNTRLAEKKGVKVRFIKYGESDFDEIFDKFFKIVNSTAKRKGVSFHVREHYINMFSEIPNDSISLVVAEFEGEIIAANIVTFFGGVATYLHGATSDKYRNVMAPYLLQFKSMQKAIELNMNWYDFGGVFSSSDDAGKKGITKFKRGFSPKEEITNFGGSYDLIIASVAYKMYRRLLNIKKKIQK